ncbi:hypothetical protein ACHAPA_010837 [Fusarium lateritium]
MSLADFNVGAIVSLSPPEDGDVVWEAKQDIDWLYGPVELDGYIDTNTYEIGIAVDVAGTKLGTIFGNIKDDVRIKFNLFVAKGENKFYLKNGNEIWIHLDVKITFDGHYEGDYKILTIE